MKTRGKSPATKPSEMSFSRDAKKVSTPINPMKLPRYARRKENRVGVTRWFSFRELAAFVAIANGVNHVYAIAKVFETDQATMLRACQGLLEGRLIKEKRIKRRNRSVVEYELNEDGRDLLEVVKKFPEFIGFDKWVKHQKESGFRSVEGIQR